MVDHFSARPHNPYEQAKTPEDLGSGLQVVRTLLKLGRFEEAARAYQGGLDSALLFNLEAHVETLSLLRPFFPQGWGELPSGVNASDAAILANDAGLALYNCGESKAALSAYSSALQYDLSSEHWTHTTALLLNISVSLAGQNLLAKRLRVDALALELASALDNKEQLFACRLNLFVAQSQFGQWEAAAETWRLLNPMGRDWPRAIYRQGYAEEVFARAQFWRGTLQGQHLTAAESLAEKDNNYRTLRELHRLRGRWRLEQREYAQAVASFHEALRMARERRLPDPVSEVGMALAKYHLGRFRQPDDARHEAERLAGQRQVHHRYLALLWRAIGDRGQAEKHALAAYEGAWADGEPYVQRYALTKTTELLKAMNVPLPTLPPYDPAKDEPFPWEAAVRAAIDKLRAEREAKEKAEKETEHRKSD